MTRFRAVGDITSLLRHQSCDTFLHAVAADPVENTNIAGLGPPITATPLFSDGFSINDIGVKPVDVTTLVKYAIDGLERDRFEIRPGPSNRLKIMSRLAPNFILKQLSKPVDRVLAQPRG